MQRGLVGLEMASSHRVGASLHQVTETNYYTMVRPKSMQFDHIAQQTVSSNSPMAQPHKAPAIGADGTTLGWHANFGGSPHGTVT